MAKSREIVVRVVVEGAGSSSTSSTEEFEPVEGKQYTPSQQLRFALRARHLAKGGTDENFQPYYEDQMRRIIDAIRPN